MTKDKVWKCGSLLQETSTWKVIKTPVAARARTIAKRSREVTSESRCEDIVCNTLFVGFFADPVPDLVF